jgi:DNA-binding transcriptional ArsR family regulator
MSGKKGKSEIEGIRTELRTLAEAVWALRNQVSFEAATAAANGLAARAAYRPAVDLIEAEGRGMVATRGMARSANHDQEVTWELEVGLDSLLTADTDGPAKELSAIGHPQRLAIVKTLLNGPSTAAALVTDLELGTTGAAYHHLNVLQGAGLVSQASRGVFELSVERTGAMLTVLAGLATTSIETVAEEEDGAEAVGKKKRKKSE